MQYEFINDFKLTFSKVLVCFGNNITQWILVSYIMGITLMPLMTVTSHEFLKSNPLCFFFKDYRPIGLYNVIHELISKIIVNKIKHYLNTMAHDS